MKKAIFNWGNLSKYRNEIYGFAIFWIMIFHLCQIFKAINFNWTIFYICENGNIGVEIFLLMAGICSYFSFKKSYNVKEFLKKRVFKILKVYLLFCVPYMVVRYIFWGNSMSAFVREITFSRKQLNSFWFLLCIMICYLIYPFIYKFLQEKKYKPIITGLCLYILFLFILCTFKHSFFTKYEICLTRIPIFIGGGAIGPIVYEKKPIKQWLYIFFLLILLGRGPLFYVLNKISFLKIYSTIFSRFYLGLAAIGVVFLLNIIFELFDLNRIKKFFRYLSGFTLEIYVMHIVIIHVIQDFLKIKITKVGPTFIADIIFIVVSIVLARILNIILNIIKIPQRNKKLKETVKN